MSCMYRALTVLTAAILGACAQQPAPVIRYGGHTESLALSEARAIELAKRHPNAQPRVRPEYPEQAPPPLAAGQSLPAPLHITRRSTPYADAPAPSHVLVERTVYDDAYRPRYGYGYSYRRPWASFGVGLGWNPYGYGYGYGPGYGYGYGIGLGLRAPLWSAGYGRYPGYSRGFGWGGHRSWGIGGFGGFGGRSSLGFGGRGSVGFGGFGGRGSDHVRSVSGRRR